MCAGVGKQVDQESVAQQESKGCARQQPLHGCPSATGAAAIDPVIVPTLHLPACVANDSLLVLKRRQKAACMASLPSRCSCYADSAMPDSHT